jgi:hypothetical protein
MKCSTIDLGIIDDEKSENNLISFDNLDIPSPFNNLILRNLHQKKQINKFVDYFNQFCYN